MEHTPFEERGHKALSQPILRREEIARLSKEAREQLTTKTSEEILNFFRTVAVEYKDMSQMYEVLRGQKMIVRRDSPEHIISAIEENEPIHIVFPEGERYSNAVVWSPEQGIRGLENAYLEGYGTTNDVVSVIGVAQDAVVDIVSLEDASQQFAGLDRTYVRSIQGDIAPEKIMFVSVRIPAFAYPESDMTPKERDHFEEWVEATEEGKTVAPQFIHRGFLFTKNLAKQ